MLDDEVKRLAEKILLAERQKNFKLAERLRWSVGPKHSADSIRVNLRVRDMARR
jgi:hypothetical protein